ncbi:hypothetical protein [Meridianimarinicoccus sp. MJW13]|uniref:hypothetical protein n=1 Tax=Meridianimarinicoccus sp. MJW13 TaxID=2720031 RepID=UPI0018668A32|nr:hypothetical protein [Fluviibacterium sp. MJW13]
MSRAYKIRAKVHRVYAVDEVLKLYGICRNTLSNWVSCGLVPSPGAGPQIFRGAELNRFHTARRARGRRQLRMGQFFCLRCKVAVVPVVSSLSFPQHDKRGAMAIAVCSECDCTVMKRLGQTEYDRLREARDTNTSLAHADESEGPSPACVGKNHGSETQIDPSLNDRILHSWQICAGRFDVKTVDAHLTYIREFDA